MCAHVQCRGCSRLRNLAAALAAGALLCHCSAPPLVAPPCYVSAGSHRPSLARQSIGYSSRGRSTIRLPFGRQLAAEVAPAKSSAEAEPEEAGQSTREMLRFAVPALGISLANPLMSNIDNAFVGQIYGTQALAAMSPGTILSEYVLYLFIFMPRATIGLVARAQAKGTEVAKRELGRALSAALGFGAAITVTMLVATPSLLQWIGVAPALQPAAASYARIRGLVAWASLTQSVALSALLATRDSVTPLKVVLTAASLNCLGDWLLCKWPLRLGVSGAAAATSVSTLAGFVLMLRALRRKGLLQRPRLHSWAEMAPLFDYARPLAVVILARFLGLTSMAVSAGRLGIVSQAAYQVLANVLLLFGLCGEPLSQTAQAMLPKLLDAGPKRSHEARRALKNLILLASVVCLVIGCLSAIALSYGTGIFTRDAAVRTTVQGCATVVSLCIASLVFSQMIDGSLLAAREFGYVIRLSMVTTAVQLSFLFAVVNLHWSLSCIFLSLAFRYWIFATSTAVRVFSGIGPLGAAVRAKPHSVS